MLELPTGRTNAHWHINEFGAPTSPPIALSKYSGIIGLLVRDFIPIKYQKWTGKANDPTVVPESEKAHIWETELPKYFTFPWEGEYNRDRVQKKAYEIMGSCFKTFKGHLHKKFILKDREQNFDEGEFTKQRPFWQEFKEYRLSEEFKQLSRQNKENSQKSDNHHHVGSHGYAKLMPVIEA